MAFLGAVAFFGVVDFGPILSGIVRGFGSKNDDNDRMVQRVQEQSSEESSYDVLRVGVGKIRDEIEREGGSARGRAVYLCVVISA